MLKSGSETQILERIQFENALWNAGRIEEDFDKMPRRPYFELFKPLAEESTVRRAVVLMGPRREGKTDMRYHQVQDFIDAGISPRRILFITVENLIYLNIRLEQLFKFGRKTAGYPETWKDSG